MYMKETIKEDSIQISDYIEGIPTGRKMLEERFRLIQSYYDKLWKEIQREFGANYIHNAFLDADVYIVKNESDKKTVRQALYNWQSTYAVKHLRKVVEEASAIGRIVPFPQTLSFVMVRQCERKRYFLAGDLLVSL